MVSTPDELARQAAAVARVRAASVNREYAQHQFIEEIREAYRQGAAVKDIARAAGITRQRVHQIVHERP